MSNNKLNIDLTDYMNQLRHDLRFLETKTKKYKIFFRGKSFDFDGFRSYEAEDDFSLIDWKSSIRANKLLVKQYREEEDLKAMFIIDVGSQMIAGSTPKLKCEYSAEVILSLADLILSSQNKVGYILYSDKVKYFSIPKRGKRTFSFLLELLADPKTYGGGSDIKQALEFVEKNFDSSYSVIFIVSDFIRVSDKVKTNFNIIGDRFETIALMIKDPIDKKLPMISGEFIIEDPVKKEQLLIEPKLARRIYEKNALEQENMVKEILKTSKIDFLELSTDGHFVPLLTTFLKNRVERKSII